MTHCIARYIVKKIQLFRKFWMPDRRHNDALAEWINLVLDAEHDPAIRRKLLNDKVYPSTRRRLTYGKKEEKRSV